MTELFYQLALSFIPRIGNKAIQILIAHCGSAEAVFRESKKNLTKIEQIGPILAKSISSFHDFARVEKELHFIQSKQIDTHFYLSSSYPKRLKECPDFPILFYSKGNVNLDNQYMLSIVGTRNATEYGKDFCDRLIHEISNRHYNVCIVSGLAYGIDIAAHKAAVKYNVPTIGVVAHGLDQIYPKQHRSIAEQMVKNGAILSEFPSMTNISPSLFIRRNRIIAGLCDATLVVESAQKGGALYTAEIAASYSREVLAVPGRIHDKYSMGCNKIIKNNLAAMVESVEDIEYQLQWTTEKVSEPIQRKLFVELTPDEQIIVDALAKEGTMQIDLLCELTGLRLPKISSVLLKLEFAGLVKNLPGKQFALID